MTETGADFKVGEEVLYGGLRYVIAGRSGTPAYRYRLLATAPDGAKMVWASSGEFERLASYTRSRDDSADY